MEAARALVADPQPDALQQVAAALRAYDGVLEGGRGKPIPSATARSAFAQGRPGLSRDRAAAIGGWQRGRPHRPQGR